MWAPVHRTQCWQTASYSNETDSSLKRRPHADRSRGLNLFTLQRRQLWGGLIWTLKLTRSFFQLDLLSLFTFHRNPDFRSHPFMLHKPRIHAPTSKHWSVTLMNPSNGIPADVVMPPSIDAFKTRFDWAWIFTFPDLNWSKSGILTSIHMVCESAYRWQGYHLWYLCDGYD